jgi:glycosyltransferase involved in cell wall biosynthesis
LNQSFKDFEFIIINDGSTDKSLEMIKSFKDKRIILIDRENKGLIATLNEGIEIARGKYIARMDQDDISLPERFSKQKDLMGNNNLDICGCHFIFIDELNNYLSARVTSISHDLIKVILTRSAPFAHGSVMMRKEFLTNSKSKYGDTLFEKAEDYDLWIKLYEKGAKFSNVDEFLFYYRDTENTLSKNNMNYLHARKLSDHFVSNNFASIENIIFTNSKRLNEFEYEHISYFIFKTFFKRNIFQNIKYLKRIPTKFNVLNLLRIVFR